MKENKIIYILLEGSDVSLGIDRIDKSAILLYCFKYLSQCECHHTVCKYSAYFRIFLKKIYLRRFKNIPNNRIFCIKRICC